jgi:cytochrome c-type biogenesis protein
MDQTALGIAFVAGVFATFNPCGFAMLPAYLSLAILEVGHQPRRSQLIGRALKFSSLMGVGILAVFSIFSLVIFPISTSIQRYLPYITTALGFGVVALGGYILWRGPVAMGKIWSPQVSPTGNFLTYILYGVTFALGSISCTIGPFLAITSRAINENYMHSLLIYIFYALGFIATIAILALLTAFSQQFLIRKIRNSGGVLERVMAVIIILVGLYLIYFGATELALQRGSTSNQSILELAYQIQGSIITFISSVLRTVGLMS